MPGRGLLTLLLLLATAAASPADPTPTLPPQPQRLATAVAPEDEIHTVHLVMSHHLDVGLDLPMKITADCVGFATKIVQRYFDIFIPRILRLAEEQAAHPEPFVYQIHSWIASLYVDCVPWRVRTDCPANPGTLRCPSPAAVARFDKAVRNGTIAYTASPFNIDAQDVGDPALFVDEVRDVAGALDARYGRAEGARVWSNVDVKGFARASIPLLRAAGVTSSRSGKTATRPTMAARTAGECSPRSAAATPRCSAGVTSAPARRSSFFIMMGTEVPCCRATGRTAWTTASSRPTAWRWPPTSGRTTQALPRASLRCRR